MDDPDAPIRAAAFDHVRRLSETCAHLTADDLAPGFIYAGERLPLVNPQRGIFKPQRMRFLALHPLRFSAGGRVWYDDQGQAHRQIFKGDETVDYAFREKSSGHRSF